jgi:eukaryotic-like serine/threonine-protein kinase
MHPTEISDRLNIDLIRKIAEGGMGTVYEGRQNGAGGFEKSIAVKLIREEYSQINDFRSNFFGEAQLVADLIHTNIVQTYHLGDFNGQYFITMELVNGINLSEFISIHRRLRKKIPVDLAVFIASRICRGLAYAHRKQDKRGRALTIVHRDVNPRNVMLACEGDVKLTDFGIAKARNLMYNQEGRVIAGRYEYISPEQARKEVTDERADLFSIGVVLSEMLDGYNRFLGIDDDTSIRNILEMDLPDYSADIPDVDETLNRLLQKLLKRDRELRYQDAASALTDLEFYMYGEGYGPTNEKLSEYLGQLFLEAGLFEDNPTLKFYFPNTDNK